MTVPVTVRDKILDPCVVREYLGTLSGVSLSLYHPRGEQGPRRSPIRTDPTPLYTVRPFSDTSYTVVNFPSVSFALGPSNGSA